MSKPDLISPEVECLKLKAAINENHRLAQKSAADAVQRAIAAGELLCKWKELLTHGKFEAFVESHFEGSIKNAQRYMTAAKGLKALPKNATLSLLSTEDTLSGLLVRVKKPKKSISAKGSPGGGLSPSSTVPPAFAAPESGEAADSNSVAQISEKGKPGGVANPTSSEPHPVSSGPASEEAADSKGEDERTDSQGNEAQETDPRPPRSGKDKPGRVDYGKCPNCAGTKWEDIGFGADRTVTCAKCNHPHGEPVGDRAEDADPAGTLRAKTVKTMEAAMRCYDDLNLLLPRAGIHKQSIELCKTLLKSAKGWK